jgi:hypothetical protein
MERLCKLQVAEKVSVPEWDHSRAGPSGSTVGFSHGKRQTPFRTYDLELRECVIVLKNVEISYYRHIEAKDNLQPKTATTPPQKNKERYYKNQTRSKTDQRQTPARRKQPLHPTP